MTTESGNADYQADRQSAPGAPTLRAVVGCHRIEEEMFGRAFDPQIVRRIGAFVQPYRRQFLISVVAVLVFTLTQLAIPMIIRRAIDQGVMAGDRGGDGLVAVGFWRGDRRQLCRQPCAGKRGRPGGRERAVRHPPRHVRPSAAGVAVIHGQDRGRAA